MERVALKLEVSSPHDGSRSTQESEQDHLLVFCALAHIPHVNQVHLRLVTLIHRVVQSPMSPRPIAWRMTLTGLSVQLDRVAILLRVVRATSSPHAPLSWRRFV